MARLGILTGLVPLLYPVLVHAAVATGSSALRFLALVVLIISVLGPWLLRRRPLAWLAAIVLIGASVVMADTIGAQVFFYATPVLIYLAMACFFGRTLLPGRTPLISHLARAIRGPLPGPVARYTRAVTGFWFVTMLGMALANLLLALFAPIELWSLFANLLNTVIVAVVFVAEWWVRQRVIGEYEHLGWRDYLAALRGIDYRNMVRG